MEEKERAQDMSKGQDKKEIMPNFLKDLNTEILEQLTAGSSEKNVVGLAGDVKELKVVEDICGLRFKGYLGLIEVERPSGITDTLVVAFAWDTPYKSTNGVKFDVLREYPAGSRLLLYGKMQTLKDFSTGRQQVFVLADFVALSPSALFSRLCFFLMFSLSVLYHFCPCPFFNSLCHLQRSNFVLTKFP